MYVDMTIHTCNGTAARSSLFISNNSVGIVSIGRVCFPSEVFLFFTDKV